MTDDGRARTLPARHPLAWGSRMTEPFLTRRGFLGASAAAALTSPVPHPGAMSIHLPDPDLLTALDTAEVIRVVNRVALTADARDWAGCRACFADRVRVDYTSLAGGEPEMLDADALMARWRGVLPGFDATHHQIGSHDVSVTGDRATCVSAFRSQHRIGALADGETWDLDGRYHHELARTAEGWRITSMTMTAVFMRGDPSLIQRAAARASSAN